MLDKRRRNGEIKGNGETVARLIDRIEYKRLHERERGRGQYAAESPLIYTMLTTHMHTHTHATHMRTHTDFLMQPSLEPTRLPRATRSRTRCLPHRRTVPTPESNNQTQTFPSNQTFRTPRLAETCAVTLLACRIARLFSSTH